MPKSKTERPFKQLFCDRRETLQLPGNMLKVWLCHYMHEGEKRESWVSIQTVMKETGLSRSAVDRARADLRKYGWLAQTRTMFKDDGGQIPVFMVTRGVIPPKGYTKNDATPVTPEMTQPTEGHTENDVTPVTPLAEVGHTTSKAGVTPVLAGGHTTSGVGVTPLVTYKVDTEVNSKEEPIEVDKTYEVDGAKENPANGFVGFRKCAGCVAKPVCWNEAIEGERHCGACITRQPITPKVDRYKPDSSVAFEGFDQNRVPDCAICGKPCDWDDDSTNEGYYWVYTTCGSDRCLDAHSKIEQAEQRKRIKQMQAANQPHCHYCGKPPLEGKSVCAECQEVEVEAAEFDAVEQAEMSGAFV